MKCTQKLAFLKIIKLNFLPNLSTFVKFLASDVFFVRQSASCVFVGTQVSFFSSLFFIISWIALISTRSRFSRTHFDEYIKSSELEPLNKVDIEFDNKSIMLDDISTLISRQRLKNTQPVSNSSDIQISTYEKDCSKQKVPSICEAYNWPYFYQVVT